MKGAQKNFPYDDNIDGTFVRCPINKPYSRECNHELCALKSNKSLFSLLARHLKLKIFQKTALYSRLNLLSAAQYIKGFMVLLK